jgi:hypothetical protein
VSNISFQAINEQFPVAGQDNDTQVFRDNFDTIKQGLRIANEEITDLQENVARTDVNTDYNLRKIQNAVLENVREQRWDYGRLEVNRAIVDFTYGHYHILRVPSGTSEEPFQIEFLNLPGDPSTQNLGVGKIIIELTSLDGQPKNISFQTSGITEIKKNNFPIVPEGNSGTDLIVSSFADPTFIEVWRWKEDSIYVRYVGLLDRNNTESFSSGGGISTGSLLVKGTVSDIFSLPENPEDGDVYLVQNPPPTRLFSWYIDEWIDLGSFQGPEGPRGFTGTGTQGIQGLQGEAGVQGIDGAPGDTGPQGIQGIQGIQGPSDGAPGAQGIQGIQGSNGIQGIQGITGIGTQGIQGIQGSAGTGGGSGLVSRSVASATATSLANDSTANVTATGFKGYNIYKIQTSHAAWVRIYSDAASRTADVSRLESEDPLPGSGVIAEVITSGAETVLITPAVVGFNNENPVTTDIPIAITNKSGSTNTITVDITVLQIEA